MLAQFLAPLSLVFGAVCLCDVEWTGSAEVAPFSCCVDTHHCCYGHKEKAVGTPLIGDIQQLNRNAFKAVLCQTLILLPAPVMPVALEQNFLHAADPPESVLRERSFFQNWLI